VPLGCRNFHLLLLRLRLVNLIEPLCYLHEYMFLYVFSGFEQFVPVIYPWKGCEKA